MLPLPAAYQSTRVFGTAEQLWEQHFSAPIFGEDYQLLSRLLQQWRCRAAYKRDKRQQRAAEQVSTVKHQPMYTLKPWPQACLAFLYLVCFE